MHKRVQSQSQDRSDRHEMFALLNIKLKHPTIKWNFNLKFKLTTKLNELKRIYISFIKVFLKISSKSCSYFYYWCGLNSFWVQFQYLFRPFVAFFSLYVYVYLSDKHSRTFEYVNMHMCVAS